MKKLLLMLAICATAAFVACESPESGNNTDIENPKNNNETDPKKMTAEDIVEWAAKMKAANPTTAADFDAFVDALCNELTITAFGRRLVYLNDGLIINPHSEMLADGVMVHSSMSELLFLGNGECRQCFSNIEGVQEYCLLEWSADRDTQTIKLVSPHLRELGSKYAETELKLAAFGPHPYFGENIYLVEGLQPHDDTYKHEGDFVQYFIDATPAPELRAKIIGEYTPHK